MTRFPMYHSQGSQCYLRTHRPHPDALARYAHAWQKLREFSFFRTIGSQMIHRVLN